MPLPVKNHNNQFKCISEHSLTCTKTIAQHLRRSYILDYIKLLPLQKDTWYEGMQVIWVYKNLTFKANNLPIHLCRTNWTTPPLPLPMTLMVSRSSRENCRSISLASAGCPCSKLRVSFNLTVSNFPPTIKITNTIITSKPLLMKNFQKLTLFSLSSDASLNPFRFRSKSPSWNVPLAVLRIHIYYIAISSTQDPHDPNTNTKNFILLRRYQILQTPNDIHIDQIKLSPIRVSQDPNTTITN